LCCFFYFEPVHSVLLFRAGYGGQSWMKHWDKVAAAYGL